MRPNFTVHPVRFSPLCIITQPNTHRNGEKTSERMEPATYSIDRTCNNKKMRYFRKKHSDEKQGKEFLSEMEIWNPGTQKNKKRTNK